MVDKSDKKGVEMKQLPLPLKFKEEKDDCWLGSTGCYEIIFGGRSTVTRDSTTSNENYWRIIR